MKMKDASPNIKSNERHDNEKENQKVFSRIDIIFDGVAGVVYLIVANPLWTGIALHEWLSIGVLVIFFVHLFCHFEWLLETLRHAFVHPSFARAGNLILDIAILIALVICGVSGVLISGAVLPAMGLVAPGYFLWDPLHALSAKVLLALLLLHVILHIKCFSKLFGKGKEQ